MQNYQHFIPYENRLFNIILIFSRYDVHTFVLYLLPVDNTITSVVFAVDSCGKRVIALPIA